MLRHLHDYVVERRGGRDPDEVGIECGGLIDQFLGIEVLGLTVQDADFVAFLLRNGGQIAEVQRRPSGCLVGENGKKAIGASPTRIE
jgi:hypothetical protein